MPPHASTRISIGTLVVAYQGKDGIVDHVLIIGSNALAHLGDTAVVLDRLGALHLGEDEIGIAAGAHVAPGLTIVGVLVDHELLGEGCILVVELDSLVAGHVDSVAEAPLELDKTDDAIVHNAAVLTVDVFVDLAGASIELNGAYALGVDKNLVGDGRRARDAPRGSIVGHLVDKDLSASLYHLLIFFNRICWHNHVM